MLWGGLKERGRLWVQEINKTRTMIDEERWDPTLFRNCVIELLESKHVFLSFSYLKKKNSNNVLTSSQKKTAALSIGNDLAGPSSQEKMKRLTVLSLPSGNKEVKERVESFTDRSTATETPLGSFFLTKSLLRERESLYLSIYFLSTPLLSWSSIKESKALRSCSHRSARQQQKEPNGRAH